MDPAFPFKFNLIIKSPEEESRSDKYGDKKNRFLNAIFDSQMKS